MRGKPLVPRISLRHRDDERRLAGRQCESKPQEAHYATHYVAEWYGLPRKTAEGSTLLEH